MERKMKFLSNLKKGILFASFTVAALLVLSCEIGLGAAVDTERPKLQITYPPKGAVIMDNFTLAGTVSDDVGLNYLKVTLTNKDLKTTYTYSSKEGQVLWVDPGKNWSKGTTWTASIGKKTEGQTLYNGWDLPDGEYFIDVEANDGYGTTSDRRSVTIDNTPPVFIVENLVYTENNTNDKSVFGHKINLIGEAKDENEISNVHFKVYNEAKEEILDSKLDYEMTSNGILLAQYSQRVPEDEKAKLLAENYNKIYGIDFGNDKPVEEKDRYLTAVLSDNARKYVSPVFEAVTEEVEKTLGTGEGNFSTEIYFTTTSDKLGISIDELKEYRKHLSENSEMDEKLSALSANNITKLDFSDFSSVPKLHINPKLEPKWYINGFEKKDGSSFATAYMGAPIPFNFEWGNNKEKFRPSNIRVVLAKLKVNVNDDDDFETVISNEEIKATTESNENAIILIPNGEWSEDLTETFTKSVKIENDLIQTPNCYRIFVFGHDGSGLDGQEFEERENSIFAFKARKSTQPPKIVFLSKNGGKDEENNLLPKDDSVIGLGTGKIPFWFKVLTDGEKLQYLPQIKVTVNGINSVLDDSVNSYFMLEKNPDVIPENPESVQDDSREKLQYTFNWTLKKNPAKPLPTKETSPEWNGEFPFNISVSVTDMGGGEKTEYINFLLDNKEPVVTVEDVTAPDMTKTVNKLNGIVKIPVSFEDNNLVKDEATNKYLGKYVVYNEAGEKIFGPESVENKQEISLDTRSFPPKIKLEVYVEDSYGNIGKIQKNYLVDQNTDKPVLKLENLVEGKFNNFGLVKNNTIEGSVTDDDAGFGKIEARVRDYTATDWTGSDWYEISNGKTSIKWNFTNEVGTEGNKKALISSEGKYKVQFKVSDSEGFASGIVESAIYDILSDKTKPEFGTPEVSNGVLDGSEFFVKNNTTAGITLKLTEANLKKITVNGSETGITKTQKAGDEWEIKYNWVPGNSASGLYELKFIAEDDSTNTNYTTVTIHYVKELPVISDVEVTPELLAGDKVNGIISFKGNIDQSVNETKIKTINLELKQNGIALTGYSTTIENSASFEWTGINTTLAPFTDNEQLDLVITAEDIAGNKNSKTYSVNIDQSTDKPVMKLNNMVSGEENAFGLTTNNEIEISVTDDDPGFGKIEVRVRDADVSDWPDENWYAIADGKTETTWKFTEAVLNSSALITSDGKYKVQFRGTDSKGLPTGVVLSPEYELIADSTRPVFGSETVTNGVLDGNEYFVKKDTTAKISLEVTEANLKEVTVNGTVVPFTVVTEGKSNVIYNWVPGSNASGSYDLVFAATDKSGNAAVQKTVTIHYVKELPEITEVEITPEVLTGNKVNGIVTYKGNVEHDVKVVSLNLELKQNGTALTEYSKTIENSASFEWTGINTTLAAFTDNKQLDLVVTATDIAGNSNSKTYSVNIDQSTDKPVISFEEDKIDDTWTGFEDVENPEKNPGSKKNLLGVNDNSTFYVYAVDDDAIGSVTVQAFKANGTPVAVAKTYTADKLDSENKVQCDIKNDLGISEAGNYIIKVNAKDDKTKTHLSAENNAQEKVLFIVVDGVPPVISNVKVDGKTYNGPVYISGKKNISFDVTEMHLTSVSVYGISVKLGTPDTTIGTPDTTSGSKVYSYTVPFIPNNASTVVVIKADDGTGLSASREITINHDKSAPVIVAPVVTPTVFETNTVNGIISISGSVSDDSGYDNVQGKVEDEKLEVKLERLDGTSWSVVSGATFTRKNQKFTLSDFDTTSLKDKTDASKAFKGKIRISVFATDRAGNVSGTEPAYFEYEVDQDSDLPIYKFTNIDADATEEKTNLFGLGKWKITGTVKDDDGAVKLYYKDGEKYEGIDLSKIDNKNEQTFTFEVPHSAGQKGKKEVEFLCVENEGAADSTNKKTVKKVLYAIDDQTPNVNSKKLDGNEIGSNDIKLFTRADRKIELVVSDDNGIAKVERYDETSEQWVESDIKKISEEKYEHHITTDNTDADGTKTEKYKLTDIYGREKSDIEVTYVVDTTPPDGTPEIKVDDKDYDSTKWLNEGTVDIAITGITDDNLTETVSYKVTGESSGSGNVPIQPGIVSNIVSNTVALSDGNSTVTYTYSDKAGNKKDVKFSVNVDTKKPEATVKSVSGVKKPGSLQLSFDATDSQLQNVSGLAYAYIGTSSDFSLTTKGGANGYLKKIELFETTGEGDAAETTYPVSKAGITTEVEIPSTDGKYQYYVVLEDQAGNKSDYTGFGEFTIDGTKPEVRINSVSDADTTTADVVDVNKIIRISGTAEDLHPSGIPGLAIYAVGSDGKKTGSAIGATGLITPVMEPANTFASWVYDVDTTKLSNDNTKYVFEVTASDSVENSGSNFVVLNVNQTSDRPVVSLDSIKTDGTTTLSRGEFEWTLSDDDGAVSSVAVKVTRKGENGTYSNVETAGIDEEGFKTITAENGKYKYTIPSYKDAQNNDTTDGSYKLYFKVTDAKSNSFTSTDATTNAHTEPRIKNGESETGTVLAFDVDGTPPVIETVQVQVKAEGAVSYGDKVDFKSSVHYGGPKKRYIKLSIPVTDNVITDSKDIIVKVKVGDEKAVSLPSTAYNSTVSAFEHDINFEKVTSGSVAIIIEAADKSGQSSKKYFNIFVDNLEPNADEKGVQYMTPSIDTEVTANVSVSANINDDSTANSRVAFVKYYVPKNNGIDAETTPSEATPWSTTDLTFSDVVMKLELKGLATAEGNIENIYSGHPQTAPGSGIYYIPVWFRLEDYCGNISYVEKTIRYNPDAVRPRIKLTYPVHNKTVGTGVSAKDYVVLGGSILLAGSAEDNVAVDAVYVQYDINGDGKYSKTDVAYLIDKGYIVVKIEDGTEVTAADSIFINDDTCDKWGIKVEGTTSWNTQFAASGLTGLEIGGMDDENNPTNPDNKTLNIRMCARDKDYPVHHTSAWTEELHISVNNTVPQFGQFYLIQNAGKDEEKKLPYENGMFIKGDNWRLEGTVVDNDGISKVQIGSTEVTDKSEYNDSVTKYTGFTVRVPVDTENENFTVELTAYDSDKGITTSQYSINVDNTPPAFKDGANDNTLVLFAGEHGKTKIDSKNYVQNSNGWTTIASKASEAGSGFARAVFYVERYKSKVGDTYMDRRFYNVMTGGRINASDVTMNGDKLPVVTKEISEVEGDHYSFTVSELNENIRVGGLVIIGNVYKTITAIDKENKKITVSEKIESAWTDGKQKNAQFVYAFVVDHTGESTDSDGNVKYDDGDGIVESLTKSANEYTWDASFDSHNIPDGPLTINVVVFDVAGNSRHGSVVTRITNNPPRITSVKLGTNLNYDDEIQDTDTYSEYTKFYAYKGSHGETDTNRGKEIWNLVPSDETESKDRAWVIKKDLSLKPEFVGGNAPFYYVFSKESGKGNYLSIPAAGTNLASETTNTGVQGKFDKDGALTVPNNSIGSDGENGINTYRFTFWDSTEESTVGVNTGWCILNVELKQDLEDSIKPVAHVHPFFWKGRGDGNNSVSWNGNTPKGHIELESDLTTGANGITGTTVNGTALGTDPKVSGTIVIRGTAYDDTKLSKVIVTYDGIIDGSTNKCEASYNGSTWTDNSTADKGYSLSVTDLNGGVTQRGHLVKWALTIDTSKVVTGDVKETGLDKKVSVTAVAAFGEGSNNTSTVIDSNSGVTGTATFYATEAQAALGKYYAAEDKALSHKADYKTSTADGQTEIFDRVVELVGVKTAATASDPAVNEYKVYGTNSQYQMDIVPYVTEVVTNLSSGKVTNPSVYNRTANGHYPVQSVVTNVDPGKMTNIASEDIVLRGFNLGGTVSVAAASTTDGKALPGGKIITATGSKKVDELCFNADKLKSGRPVITVNNIPLMNNLNRNDAKGECTSDTDEKDYDNCYNRTPNYENNNLLTDDIEFDVWEFNDTIVKAANGQFISGFAMQINQNNKKVQYAFGGSDRTFVSAKNGNNSCEYQNRVDDYVIPSSIGFHVNEAGTTFLSSYLWGKDKSNYRIVNGGTETNALNINGAEAGIKDMIRSPAFASSSSTNYLAYYNKKTNQICLKVGEQLSLTNTDIDIDIDKKAQVIAGKIQTGRKAGEYVSIAVTKDNNKNDVLCAVWSNQSGNTLQYSYKENASTVSIDNQASPTNWEDVTDIFNGVAQHCQIAVDANGGIHIAAFVNGGLQYAYAENYSSTFYTCTVDSGNTGNNLKLDVALVNVAPSGTTAAYRPMPVIGYYSGTGQRPKYAKLMTSEWLTTTNTVKNADAFRPSDGISSDKFTGAWEVNYVPVLKTMNIDSDEKIYAGLWKNSGQLATSASYSSGTTLNKSTYNNTAYRDNNDFSSNTYGNGTSNGILCYIADGGARVESAQMR